MDIYDVKLNATPLSKRKRLRNIAFQFAICALLYFVIEWLWPGHHEKDEISGMVIKALLWASAISLYFSFKKAPDYQYQLVVDEDQITTRVFKSNNWHPSRTIRRDQVKTIVERKRGLFISARTQAGTFLWSGIWIPRHLADYEYLKRLVFSWKVTSTT